jgi:hypothetical protein
VTEIRPNEDGANGIRTRDLHAASVALSQLSYGPAGSKIPQRLLNRFAGDAEDVDAHAIPAGVAGVLFTLAAAVIVAVLLVYFALGVGETD